jgi:hypothetical protein
VEVKLKRDSMEIIENDLYKVEYDANLKVVIHTPKPLHIDNRLMESMQVITDMIISNKPSFYISDLRNLSILSVDEFDKIAKIFASAIAKTNICELFIVAPTEKMQKTYFEKLIKTYEGTENVPPFVLFESVDSAKDRIQNLI